MIDVHAHYLAPSVVDEIARHGSTLGVAYNDADRTFVFPSGPSRPLPPLLLDLERRRTWNRERGIGLQVLSPWLDVIGDDLPPADASDWARLMNDAVAADIGADRSFVAFALLPVASGKAAATELARSVEQLGFVGGALPTQVDGRNLEDAGLDDLFEAAQSLDVPLFLHPFRVLGAERMGADFLTNVCGNPFETTLAALTLFFSGIFERFPSLRILLSHGGGALPYIAGRAAHASTAVPGIRRRMAAPEDVLERYYYDSVVHDAHALAFALARLRPERVALGTDVPFPMGIDAPGPYIAGAIARAGLPEYAFEAVVRGTAGAILAHRLDPTHELH